jgi:hypothetical protein
MEEYKGKEEIKTYISDDKYYFKLCVYPLYPVNPFYIKKSGDGILFTRENKEIESLQFETIPDKIYWENNKLVLEYNIEDFDFNSIDKDAILLQDNTPSKNINYENEMPYAFKKQIPHNYTLRQYVYDIGALGYSTNHFAFMNKNVSEDKAIVLFKVTNGYKWRADWSNIKKGKLLIEYYVYE